MSSLIWRTLAWIRVLYNAIFPSQGVGSTPIHRSPWRNWLTRHLVYSFFNSGSHCFRPIQPIRGRVLNKYQKKQMFVSDLLCFCPLHARWIMLPCNMIKLTWDLCMSTYNIIMSTWAIYVIMLTSDLNWVVCSMYVAC